jgi:hypothetical protein
MQLNLFRLGFGLLIGVAGVTLPQGVGLQAQQEEQAGHTGFGQGTGVLPAGLTGSSSVFPGVTLQEGMLEGATTFTVRIENLSQGSVLKSASGGEAPFAIAPGLWLVLIGNNPMFKPGKLDKGEGLEQLAEDGNPEVIADDMLDESEVVMGGIFNTPVGASAPGAAGPGQAFEFTIAAKPGMRLAYGEMFGQSNDLFYAPDRKGIPLFDEKGKPLGGDVTSQVILWDAGTEVNQEPGFGSDQAPRQPAPNTGASESKPVGPAKDQFTYPATAKVLRVTITPSS